MTSKFTPEHRRKLSEAKKGHSPTNKGVHHTPEAILKMKKAHTGKKLSLEHRKKIGVGNLGKRLSEGSVNLTTFY